MRLRVAYGHVIRIIRQRNNLSLREVSAKTGISISHLSEFERGQNEISSELFEDLCRGMGAKQSEILLEAYRIIARGENKNEPKAIA